MSDDNSSNNNSDDSSERRRAARCPVCQGPAVANDSGAIRCRNSLCTQNHQGIICPRCGSGDLDSVRIKKGTDAYEFTCRDCEHVW